MFWLGAIPLTAGITVLWMTLDWAAALIGMTCWLALVLIMAWTVQVIATYLRSIRLPSRVNGQQAELAMMLLGLTYFMVMLGSFASETQPYWLSPLTRLFFLGCGGIGRQSGCDFVLEHLFVIRYLLELALTSQSPRTILSTKDRTGTETVFSDT